MEYWWLRLLGVDTKDIPPGAHLEFVLTNPFHSWVWIVFVGVLAVLVWGIFRIYRREIDTCPPKWKLFLATVRVLVILLLAAALLGPAIAISKQRTEQPWLAVLVDDSLSMSFKDRYLDDDAVGPVARFLAKDATAVRAAPVARAALVSEVLHRDDQKLLRDLVARCKVRVIYFSSKTQVEWTSALSPAEPASKDPKAPADKIEPLPALSAAGTSTNLAKALREALRTAQNSPLAGIVVLTDGQSNEGDSPLAVAEKAASLHIPIFAVGVGDKSRERAVTVLSLSGPDSVWANDPVYLDAVVKAANYGDVTVPLKLFARAAGDASANGDGDEVARQTVTLSGAREQESIRLSYIPKKTGKYILTVRADPPDPSLADPDMDKERLTKQMEVAVLDQKAKVLLISGVPSWEYQLVRALLSREKTIELTCWLQSRDPEAPAEGVNPEIKALPEKLEDLVKFDVILMFDPANRTDYSPREINPQWVENLKKFVGEHSGGLLYLAGPAYTSQFLSESESRDIADLLPVVIDNLALRDAAALITEYNRESRVQPTPDGLTGVLMFDPDPRANNNLWSVMPGIYWNFPALKAKPAARVLLETGGDGSGAGGASGGSGEQAKPLLVAGNYGAGRVLYMGFDGSWRWRRVGKDSEFFDKFWVQSVRYLIEGRRVGGHRGRLTLEPRRVEIGSPVKVTARLYDATMKGLTVPEVTATVRSSPAAASSEVTLHAVPDAKGELSGDYQGAIAAAALGINEVTVNLAGDKPGEVAVPTESFMVDVPRAEYSQRGLNEAGLRELAQRSGPDGRYFDIDKVFEVPAAIPVHPETRIVRFKPRDLWDTNRLLLVIVALLTVEWAVRKRHKLM